VTVEARPRRPGTVRRWWDGLSVCDAGSWWLTAFLALVGFVAVYSFAVWTTPGQWLDAHGFADSDRVVPDVAEGLLPWFVRVALPTLLAASTAVVGLVNLAQRAWRQLITALVVVGVSVPAAWWLKTRLLWVPTGGDDLRIYEQGTYPAVHVAVVTALVVALMLLWPGPLSLVHMVLGTVLVAMACLGNVSGLAHVPSDVIGAVLLVTAVAAASLAVVRPCSPGPLRVAKQGHGTSIE
jgi:hypothetical protein